MWVMSERQLQVAVKAGSNVNTPCCERRLLTSMARVPAVPSTTGNCALVPCGLVNSKTSCVISTNSVCACCCLVVASVVVAGLVRILAFGIEVYHPAMAGVSGAGIVSACRLCCIRHRARLRASHPLACEAQRGRLYRWLAVPASYERPARQHRCRPTLLTAGEAGPVIRNLCWIGISRRLNSPERTATGQWPV